MRTNTKWNRKRHRELEKECNRSVCKIKTLDIFSRSHIDTYPRPTQDDLSYFPFKPQLSQCQDRTYRKHTSLLVFKLCMFVQLAGQDFLTANPSIRILLFSNSSEGSSTLLRVWTERTHTQHILLLVECWVLSTLIPIRSETCLCVC